MEIKIMIRSLDSLINSSNLLDWNLRNLMIIINVINVNTPNTLCSMIKTDRLQKKKTRIVKVEVLDTR